MTDYRETYQIGRLSLGIEDYEQKGDHFFPEEYAAGKVPRFHVWCNGCGIGRAQQLMEARLILIAHAQMRVTKAWADAVDEVKSTTELLKILNDRKATPARKLKSFLRRTRS